MEELSEPTRLYDREERRLQGAPVSEGIAIGRPFFLGSFEEEESDLEVSIPHEEVENEILRYRKALTLSREDLKQLQDKLEKEGSTDAREIIDAHIQMLSDPLMTTHMEEMIRKMKQNTEVVFRSVMADYQEKLSQVQDSLFQQRVIDVIDLSHRVLNHLRPKTRDRFAQIPQNAVIFAKELAPSETAEAQASRVSAFVTQKGGGSSHAALIARSKGIPFVASIDTQLFKSVQGECVIVNGRTGDVIINPTDKTLKEHRRLQLLLKKRTRQLDSETLLPSQTLDGRSVPLYANVGSVLELEEMRAYGAQGVGLFRTEFLLSKEEEFLYLEEKQFSTYQEVFRIGQNLPLAMRLFDLDEEKFPTVLPLCDKRVGVRMGCRGIRFLLNHEELFKRQLRALLRASALGQLRLLLPFVSNVEEVRLTKKLIRNIEKELKSQHVRVKRVLLGCMIEVPAAVMMAQEIAEECDFLSLGTNDLIQYTLGIERSQIEMNTPYSVLHPSVLRMIQRVIESAHLVRKPVTLCGEIATSTDLIPLLVGLGVDAFSCSIRYLPQVKRAVRQCTYRQAIAWAQAALTCRTQKESEKILKKMGAFKREG